MKVGFIGLVWVGQGMARNIATAGVSLLVYNTSPAAVQALVERSARLGVLDCTSCCN